ncbi:alpha/beta hydrolase [Blattabacterium cuenoti]|uniref:alpha/beta hydrolase n=1 Tax=Blattabacterium cuenoti TaxID=1653831 RepID=UPI00163CFF47|nr:phospholipase [Blattabacterium cuenoti]
MNLYEDYSIRYRLRKSNNKTPILFLMIHGYGSNENNLFHFEKDISDNFFIISLQGIYCIEKNYKYYWYDIDFSENKKIINVKQALNSINKISYFINESIKKYKLRDDQVWLCGFSQGAILSYAIALKNSKIKKIISLSGYIEEKILSDKIENLNLENIDLFVSHGKNDTIIPIEWIRKDIEILKKNNKISSISYREYKSGHSLNELNYKDLIDWIKKNNE